MKIHKARLGRLGKCSICKKSRIRITEVEGSDGLSKGHCDKCLKENSSTSARGQCKECESPDEILVDSPIGKICKKCGDEIFEPTGVGL